MSIRTFCGPGSKGSKLQSKDVGTLLDLLDFVGLKRGENNVESKPTPVWQSKGSALASLSQSLPFPAGGLK
jgi:hypothetical protein